MKKVFIITGESSGELYGALLARELGNRRDNVRVMGVGGEMMRREGVELVAEISGAFGLMELVSSLRELRRTMNKVIRTILNEKPDVVVLIDFPDFNIKVAKAIRHSGVKILYYVSPQVWAWRKKRVNTIAKLSDYVAVILPFEVEYYRDSGVKCEFVGHPIIEEIESVKGGKCYIKEQVGLQGDAPVLALLPGSRDSEMKRLLPVLSRLVDLFKENYPDYQFIMPVALNIDRGKYNSLFDRLRQKGVRIVDGEAVRVLSCSDLAVVASGTAALQAALLEIPLVVIYRLSPLTYWIGRMIVDVKYINLVNIMLDKEVIRELLQGMANADTIFNELKHTIEDENLRNWMIPQFRKVGGFFANRNASRRVSEIIGELAGWE
ncbi:lipid-A-disaccharide synthase [bacterium BMS3Abin07]|nr:lipid-A-disaccharide synthase [bacterium BMS3Abin07]GBE33081.1 lipid-A-disaccharide synthase [bacterium BMS3Bbin05]HDO21762.1 lipid-A-disaccharide synthase [Nitrospirota bacterium]HDZ88583.1 lipid-A-disaccharide synthase [Nitrospirota bacterium]